MQRLPAMSDMENQTDLVSNENELLKPMIKLPKRRWAKWVRTSQRLREGLRLELVLAFLATVAAIVTYVAMSRKEAALDVTNSSTIRAMFLVNLFLILALGAVIFRWLAKVWLARRSDAPGSRLHTRVVAVFFSDRDRTADYHGCLFIVVFGIWHPGLVFR